MIWQWHDLAKTTAWDHRAGTVHVGPSQYRLGSSRISWEVVFQRAPSVCVCCAPSIASSRDCISG